MNLSERRACSIVGADRKMVRYRSRRPPETELRGRLRELANERSRFGYRRLFILLRREGEASGINRIYRLYREEGLTVRKRRARRRAVGTRAPILTEARANARWSLDFVHDQFACGRRFRVPTLTPGDIVLDDLGSHKGRAVRQAIRAVGAHRLFLPPYSPDLNPIEQAFAKLKHCLRQAQARSIPDLHSATAGILQRFPPDECAAFFRNSGYAST
jgi:transposase